MPPTRVEPSLLAQSLETQEMVLREEQAQTAEIEERIKHLTQALSEAHEELEASRKRQAIFTQHIFLYQDMLRIKREAWNSQASFAPFPSPDPPEAREVRTKPARLGKLHYRMLHAIRKHGALTLGGLSEASFVPTRRVKITMAEDAREGVVLIEGDTYRLTPDGADLLKRFEEYRRSVGQELPSLEAPQGDEEREDDEPEIPLEENMAA